MDVLDQAQEIETLHRSASLTAALARHEKQRIEGAEVICLSCAEPVPLRRLASYPQAVRCLDCQATHERKEKQWSR